MKKNDAMRAAGLQTQAIPELTTREPAYYIRHKPIPCKFCGKTECDAGQAVVTRSIRKGVAYLRSRCCKGKNGEDRNWSLPVKEV